MVRGQLTFRGIFSMNTAAQADITIKTTEGFPLVKGIVSDTVGFSGSTSYTLDSSLVGVILTPLAGVVQLLLPLLPVLLVLLLFIFQYLISSSIVISFLHSLIIISILLSPLPCVLVSLLFVTLSVSLIFITNALSVIESIDSSALFTVRIQSIAALIILIKPILIFPFLALRASLEIIHFTHQIKERPWLVLPVLSRTKQRQRRSDLMIAKYDFSGNCLVRDLDIIA
jgi:hypothetical protein